VDVATLKQALTHCANGFSCCVFVHTFLLTVIT
jgi:hypothetical protein